MQRAKRHRAQLLILISTVIATLLILSAAWGWTALNPEAAAIANGKTQTESSEWKPRLRHDYSFVTIWEENGPILKGFPVYNAIEAAATFHEAEGALYVSYSEDLIDSKTQVVVLVEATSLETLLFSRLFMVRDSAWRFAIPELTWQGVYGGGPNQGQEDNMVINEARGLRAEVTVEPIATGVVAIIYRGETRELRPGEHWVVEGPNRGNRLVMVNWGRWNTSRVTYAMDPR
jgi:hypothetical protein